MAKQLGIACHRGRHRLFDAANAEKCSELDQPCILPVKSFNGGRSADGNTTGPITGADRRLCQERRQRLRGAVPEVPAVGLASPCRLGFAYPATLRLWRTDGPWGVSAVSLAIWLSGGPALAEKPLVAETLVVGWRCAKKACVVLMIAISAVSVDRDTHNIAQGCQEPTVIAEQIILAYRIWDAGERETADRTHEWGHARAMPAECCQLSPAPESWIDAHTMDQVGMPGLGETWETTVKDQLAVRR